MDLQFETKEVRSLILNQKRLELKYGKAVADSIRSRISDLRAANSFDDLDFMSERITFNKNEVYLDVGSGKHIAMQLNNRNIPINVEGSIDWNRVDRLMIKSIENGDSNGLF